MVSVQSHVGGNRQVKSEAVRGATDVLRICVIGFKDARKAYLVLHVKLRS